MDRRVFCVFDVQVLSETQKLRFADDAVDGAKSSEEEWEIIGDYGLVENWRCEVVELLESVSVSFRGWLTFDTSRHVFSDFCRTEDLEVFAVE